ncbi:MAG: hypothetical protein R6V05_06530 [Candidatus Brocadiia bacterium]
MAPMPPGRSVEQARAAAIAAARREALRRCCVMVEQTTSLDGHRVREQRTRERELGYVRAVEIVEEGLAQGEGGAAYRVVARVTVGPLSAFTIADALALARVDPWQPVARLVPAGGRWTEAADAARDELKGALRRCGVAVTDGKDVPAVEVQLEASVSRQGESGALEVSWQVQAPAPGGEGGAEDAVRFRGRWRYAGEDAPGSDWWDGMGVAVAQDVLRLWALPRWTTVRFTGVEGQRAVALVRAFRTAAGQVQADDEAGEVVVEVPLTGNPLAAVQAVLEREQLRDELQLMEAKLGAITYRLRGAAGDSDEGGNHDDPQQRGDQPPDREAQAAQPTL